MVFPVACPWCGPHVPVRAAPVGYDRWTCSSCGRSYSRDEATETEAAAGRYGRSTRKRSDRQERNNAREVGGRVTANSGAGRDKGDVKVRGLLREEDKTTRGRSYVLKLDDLRKVAAAAQGDEIPVLCVSFEDDLAQQYVVVPRAWFQQMFNTFRENQ